MNLTDEIRRQLQAKIKHEGMAYISARTGIDLAIVSKFSRGRRGHVSGTTLDILASYLGFAGIKWRNISPPPPRRSTESGHHGV
jgi:hypothetical protein